jgi:GNAT superfamily N-acetyltransferase
MLQLARVFDELPREFPILRAEALAEGFRHIERLATDFTAGIARFDAEGEALFAAFIAGELAGIGGMTLEPADPACSRLRRFYVRPDFRQQGIGRALAGALIQEALHAGRAMTVNAATPGAPGFWLAMGFRPDPRHGWTHRLDPDTA